MNTFPKLRHFFSSLSRPHAGRDWVSMLAVLGVTLLLLTLCSTYLFFGIASGSIFSPSDDTPPLPERVTRGELEEALSSFRARKLNHDSGNLPAFPLTDPARNLGQ